MSSDRCQSRLRALKITLAAPRTRVSLRGLFFMSFVTIATMLLGLNGWPRSLSMTSLGEGGCDLA